MISVANAYDFADIEAVTRQLLRSDPALPIEDVVRSLYEGLYDGEPCPSALVEAVKRALRDTSG